MSGKRENVRKSVQVEDSRFVRLEEKVQTLEVENAERFATIMAQLSHLREGVDRLINSGEDHATAHKKTEVDVASLKLRVGNAEKSIKSFNSKLWAAVIAVLGSVGTAVAALFKFPGT